MNPNDHSTDPGLSDLFAARTVRRRIPPSFQPCD
jgi:hypothetical protein